MPAARLSYFLWYPADWFMSKTRLRLTPAERAAYFEILQLCYQSEDGFIEWDEPYLVALTGVGCEAIAKVKQTLCEGNGGRWTHPRVQKEIERIRRIQERGRESANRRWRKKKTWDANANPMRTQCKHEHEHEHSKDVSLQETSLRDPQRLADQQRRARAGSGPARPDGAHPTGAPSQRRQEPKEGERHPTDPRLSWSEEYGRWLADPEPGVRYGADGEPIVTGGRSK